VRTVRLVFLSCLLALGLAASARAETGFTNSFRMSRQNSQAIGAYHQGRYEQARAGYMRAKDLAEESSPENADLHFNIGATFYQEANYEQAEKEFQQAAAAADPVLREEALYNLGNVAFQQGLKAKDVEKLKKAAEYYQQALQLNPDDEDAKFNLEVVRRHINLQQQQPPPQGGACPNPKPGDQQQNQQQNQQQGQQPPPQPGSEQKKKEQAAGSGEDEKKKKEQQNQPQPAAGGTAEPKPQPAQQVQPAGSEQPPGKLTKEEAARILQAVQKQEEEDLKRVIEATHEQQSRKEKDW